jgi:hypothetical protein
MLRNYNMLIETELRTQLRSTLGRLDDAKAREPLREALNALAKEYGVVEPRCVRDNLKARPVDLLFGPVDASLGKACRLRDAALTETDLRKAESLVAAKWEEVVGIIEAGFKQSRSDAHETA